MNNQENIKTESLERKRGVTELATELENAKDDEQIKHLVSDLLVEIENSLKLHIDANADYYYRIMQENDCLVRVDKLSNVLAAIEKNIPFSVGGEDESHYANAVIPVSKGLDIAYGEAQAPGPVRTVFAFGKTLVGFKHNKLLVEEIDFDPTDYRGGQERMYLCRHVSGLLSKDDLVCAVIRFPRRYVDDKFLTDEERVRELKNGTLRFVFRGFLISENKDQA